MASSSQELKPPRNRGDSVLGGRLAWEGTATGWWDRDAIYRVIENLTLNAAKYGLPASPILCRITRITDKHVDLTVENQGSPSTPQTAKRSLRHLRGEWVESPATKPDGASAWLSRGRSHMAIVVS
ncbi:ATP-binding protein [Pseudorhodoferax sp. Leaf267]|uniref:ATP-binding protein n=1 Tax=Pseudorhodoferax sp. Leaf267 TaxID=1736316 RepID=UPI00138F0BCD|nr:ATP-binding protein [Pseudorhodoferax sp. Leaf267]